ncbi:MAG: GNAT family N-acetyltransferase [Crocinitomicaceae bacterium]
MIRGEKINLRPVRWTDVPSILLWENDPENWEVSETAKAYTFNEIILLIESSDDLFEQGQLRFIIEEKESNTSVGAIDLFQVDFKKKSVELGILIAEKRHRNQGFATEALELVATYCENNLGLDFLYCSIQTKNQVSLNLFKKSGFEIVQEEEQNTIFDIIKLKRCVKK